MTGAPRWTSGRSAPSKCKPAWLPRRGAGRGPRDAPSCGRVGTSGGLAGARLARGPGRGTGHGHGDQAEGRTGGGTFARLRGAGGERASLGISGLQMGQPVPALGVEGQRGRAP